MKPIEENPEWHVLWKRGAIDREIAAAHGCSVTTICKWRRLYGLPPNKIIRSMTPEEQTESLRLIETGLTLREVAEQTGIFVETIRKLANRRGLSYMRTDRRTSGKEVHGTLGYGGYVELRVDVNGTYGNLVHHGSKHSGYAPLHRMRMQDQLGRELQPGEIVHHIDGDIYNNSLANLALFASVRDHLQHHQDNGVRRCKESADRW